MTSGISRRGALGGGFGLAAAWLLSACGDSDEPGKPGNNGELVVGANLELSGAGATIGKLQEQALRVAAAQMSADGIPYGQARLTVRLVIKDNASDPATAEALMHRFIDDEKVSAVLGGTSVETARAMIPVAESRKMPLLCLNSGDEIALPLPQRKYIYQLGPKASDVATLMSRELHKQKLTTIAVLASADGHGEAGVQALPRTLSTEGLGLVSVVRLPATGRAFGEAARAVADKKTLAVIVWAQAPVSAAAVAALREAGYKGKIFLDPGAGADETLGGPNAAAMEGSYIVHPSVLEGAPLMATTPSERAAKAFIYRYIQQYGAFSGFAPYAADALSLIATAARRAVSVDPLRLRGRLEAGAMEGIAGAYAFQPISHGGLEPDALTLFQARDRAWVRLS